MQETRKDQLTAQKVAIGMIFKQMLGSEDARAYLCAEKVPEPVIERVISGDTIRPAPDPADDAAAAPAPQEPDLSNTFYCHSGRRRNAVKSAVVQAALSVHRQLGRDRAEAMLRKEGLPEDVITRVLADDGARRATREPEPAASEAP